jgi:hypothetical protein
MALRKSGLRRSAMMMLTAKVAGPPGHQQKERYTGHQLTKTGEGIDSSGQGGNRADGNTAFRRKHLQRHWEATITAGNDRNVNCHGRASWHKNNLFPFWKTQL